MKLSPKTIFWRRALNFQVTWSARCQIARPAGPRVSAQPRARPNIIVILLARTFGLGDFIVAFFVAGHQHSAPD